MGCAEGLAVLGHYYPSCPQPELAIGTTNHADNSFITILLQDHVGGLQVFYQEQWIDIHPIPGALIVNAGDLLQASLSPSLLVIQYRFVGVKSKRIGFELMNLFNEKNGSFAKASMAGHPNETLAKITHVGNLKLNNNVVLLNVLVMLEYCVSLLSVHKLIKDSKLSFSVDETTCYIQDLKKDTVLGTGSESDGLKLLKNSLNLSNVDHNGHCEVCHTAKQTRDAFLLSEHKSTVFG
ncbi:ribonuclease H-like domain-containing protein [Tanacetum coccineum]